VCVCASSGLVHTCVHLSFIHCVYTIVNILHAAHVWCVSNLVISTESVAHTHTEADILLWHYVSFRVIFVSCWSLSAVAFGLCLHFNSIFPGGPGLPECLHSGFLLEPRMMDVVVTAGAIIRAKLQSYHHH